MSADNTSTATSESLSSAVDSAATSTNAAILNRLKEIENNNQMMQATIERLTAESHMKEEKIKSLSAEKRKDMEQMIETAIDAWLNSLTGVPEEVRKQFRQGISKIAQEADMENAAWEIVCNASEAHNRNVKQIESLISTCAEQGKTIESLIGSDPSFSSDASRISNDRKRQRTEPPPPPPQQPPQQRSGQGDAWDLFSNMMQTENRGVYY